MDFLKGQLDKIQQQLGGLNASQKMLTGSLITIMVMTLLWWGRYAGTSEMEPVLPQSLSAGDIAKIQGGLQAAQIPSKVIGDRVLVPADRRDEALAALAFGDAMPENTVSGFDEMSKQLSPWDPQSKTDAFIKEGKQRTLQNVIRQMAGVKSATVLIEPATGRRIGMGNEASASIHITMKDGGMGSRKLAMAAASLVAGAQQHLTLKKTQIVIGSSPYRLTDLADGPAGDEITEMAAAEEARLEEKVRGLYDNVEGLLVKVSVSVNMTATQTQSKSIDPGGVVQKEKRTNTRSESEPVPSPTVATEPGAQPNTGASIDASPQAQIAGERTREENETEYEILAGSETKTSSKPAGEITPLGAAIRVPRSYFVNMAKALSNSTAEPVMATLQPIIDGELERIRNEVASCTAIKDPQSVVVSMYNDFPSSTYVAASAAPSGTIVATLNSYGKEIAIGLLALVSLFMVSTMVRKSAAPAPIVAQPATPRETPNLDAGITIAGVVGEGDPMLDGMELDQDAVRTQQMLDQVSTLVGENPDAAANLVKRWLNRT
jgi:flagellar biosynthesis/type III secretory pathway M-ring protein FliF/YscJ